MSAAPDFDTLYQTYFSKVLKLCLGYTGSYAQAQDMAQETFVKVWQICQSSRASRWSVRGCIELR